MGLHNEFVEFDSLTADPTTPPDGCTWHRSDMNRLRVQLGGAAKSLALLDELLAGSSVQYHASQLDTPNNADWAVNALAPVLPDPDNVAILIRRFNDTIEEGVGFTVEIPSGVTNMKLKIRWKAITGAANKKVGLKLYNRGMPDNAAVESWSAGTQLADVISANNVFYQYDEETISLATLGVTAGELTQFELTRDDVSSPALSGDIGLRTLILEFS